METKEAPTMTLKQVTAAIEKLPVDDQEKLLAALKDKAWARGANRLLHADVEHGSQEFLDKLYAGNAFNYLTELPRGLEAISDTWINRVKILSAMQDPKSDEKMDLSSEEIEQKLEKSYGHLQEQLTTIRQATAASIATKVQLQSQWERNLELSKTWQLRADMAINQGNEVLVEQALLRKQQYVEAAEQIATQLAAQQVSVDVIRKHLTEVEGIVHKFNTQKQLMVARNKIASAMSIFHEIVIDLADHIQENDVPQTDAEGAPSLEVMSKSLATLERATAMIIKLEEKIRFLEEEVESLKAPANPSENS